MKLIILSVLSVLAAIWTGCKVWGVRETSNLNNRILVPGVWRVWVTYYVPEYSREEEEEVERDGDFLQCFLPELHLPVVQQSQPEQEAGQSSGQVAAVPEDS